MDLTVAICTWNRWRQLDLTLQSWSQVRVPGDIEWEVVVVNNNCTDATDDVLRRHQRQLPLRRVFEPRQGIAEARNCAGQSARGKWIIWNDDDVRVPPEHVEVYLDAIRRYPQAMLFGGPILPWFEEPPPAWLTECWDFIHGAYGGLEYSDEEIPLTNRTIPFGANYVVRTDVHRQFEYDTRLGRRAGGMIVGEETTLMQAILEAGHEGRWIPAAPIEHFIPASKMSLEFLHRSYFGFGQTQSLLKPLKLRKRLSLCWRIALKTIGARIDHMLGRERSEIKKLLKISQFRGRLKGVPTVNQPTPAPAQKAA